MQRCGVALVNLPAHMITVGNRLVRYSMQVPITGAIRTACLVGTIRFHEPPALSLDVKLATLKAAHPGWRIWFVPHASDGGVTWCAVREPTINTDTSEHLSEEIQRVERGEDAT